MHLIPTQDEVVAVLRETGALRDGHFEYPHGLHSDGYLQVPLALRYLARGGTVACAGVTMTDLPGFPYAHLYQERTIRSVASHTLPTAIRATS